MTSNDPQAKITVHPPEIPEFIYVPKLRLYVAKERALKGMNWNAQQNELWSRNDRMPTIPEFREFLNFLRTTYSDRREAEKILDEVYKAESPWHGEYLDAKFEKEGELRYINYHKFSPQGLIVPVRELIIPCLIEDKAPGISLDAWLAKATPQGLPLSNIQKGELYYLAPKDGSVAGFSANSDGPGLLCDGNPSFIYPSSGVRAIRHVA